MDSKGQGVAYEGGTGMKVPPPPPLGPWRGPSVYPPTPPPHRQDMPQWKNDGWGPPTLRPQHCGTVPFHDWHPPTQNGMPHGDQSLTTNAKNTGMGKCAK